MMKEQCFIVHIEMKNLGTSYDGDHVGHMTHQSCISYRAFTHYFWKKENLTKISLVNYLFLCCVETKISAEKWLVIMQLKVLACCIAATEAGVAHSEHLL